MEIEAECERKAGAWRVRVPDSDKLLIFTKHLDLDTEQIKDLAHEYLRVDRCDVVVKVVKTMPGILGDLVAAQEKMQEPQKLQEEASREIREVISRLRTEVLSMRDIGVLLRISPQPVAQLVD